MPSLQSRINRTQHGSTPDWPTIFSCLVKADHQKSYANGQPIEDISYLPPDSRHQVRMSGLGPVEHLQLPSECLIDDDHANTFVAVVQNLSASLTGGCSTLTEWLDCSPVLPGVADRADLLLADTAIHERLPALSNACLRPRHNLILELNRVPVSRAKRIPQRAASYLASHPEDWAQPTLSGPRPNRILSEVAEESLNIFENRFLARLIDQCDRYLLSRLRELRRLLLLYTDVLDIEELTSAHWARQNRLYEILGNMSEQKNRRQFAERNFEKLTTLRYRILGLTDSELYQSIPRRAQIPASIPNTNILNNDPRYRQARDLWHECFSGKSRQITATEQQRLTREKFESFDIFSALLVIQASMQCCDSIQSKTKAVQWDAPIELVHSVSGRFTITLHQNSRTITLRQNSRSLHVIPIFISIMTISKADQAAFHKHLDDSICTGDEDFLFLYPDSLLESAEDREQLDSMLLSLKHELVRHERARYSMLPVSPWLIKSIDDVGRAINWFLLADLYKSMPPRIEIGRKVADLIARDDNVLHLTSTSDCYELTDATIPQRILDELNRQQIKLDRINNRISELSSSHRRRDSSSGHRKDTSEIRRLKLDLHNQQILADQSTKLVMELDRACKSLQSVLRCPVCPEEDVPLKRCGDGTFWCVCPECRAEWGTRQCTKCKDPKPIIHPYSRSWDSVLEKGLSPTRIAGSDLLCTPVLTREARIRFRCSNCGETN